MQIIWYGNDEWYDEMKLVINRDDESLLTLLDKNYYLFGCEWTLKMRVSIAAKSDNLTFKTLLYVVNNHQHANNFQ